MSPHFTSRRLTFPFCPVPRDFHYTPSTVTVMRRVGAVLDRTTVCPYIYTSNEKEREKNEAEGTRAMANNCQGWPPPPCLDDTQGETKFAASRARRTPIYTSPLGIVIAPTAFSEFLSHPPGLRARKQASARVIRRRSFSGATSRYIVITASLEICADRMWGATRS